MLNILFQIILSIFLILILGFIGYSVFDREYINSIKSFNTVKNEITIIDGIYDYKTTEAIFDTQDSGQNTYINLSPSINQNGGGEYTYNFWLYRDNNSPAFNSSYKVLFLKGSKQKTLYSNSGNCLSKNDPYILVKNPLIRISNDLKSIIIEYNTLVNADALNSDGNIISSNNDICAGSSPDNNMLGIYNINDPSLMNKFVMITLIIQEISSSNDILSKNVTNCKLYLNSTLVLDRNVNSPYDGSSSGTTSMKNNKGKFYLNPTNIFSNDTITTDKKLLIADLKYYNYSLNVIEIENLYNAGFNNKNAVLPSQVSSSSNYVASGPIPKNYKTPNPY